jgi:serine protease AprX
MPGHLVLSLIYRWMLAPVTTVYRTSRVLLPLLFILSLLLGILPGLANASSEPAVLPQLSWEAAQQPLETFRVIVSRVNGNTSADLAIDVLGGTKVKEVAADAFVALLPGKAIDELGKHPAVKYITYDAAMRKTNIVDGSKLGTVYSGTIDVTQFWASPSALTGQGVGIAVLDTGINTSLPDWKGANGVSRIVAQSKFNSNTNSQSDGHGHGTHVAGIIAGNSWYRTDTALQGKYIGIAPRANLINVKVSDDQGGSYISDVVNGIDWVINNRETYNIRVMNLSLISSVAESYKTSVLAAAVERAWFNGILVVVSAGNLGPDTMFYPPANDPFVVTVGAADPVGTVTRSDDDMAPWSSYGTTQDGFSKPEVAAPGRYIAAPLASGGSTLTKRFPSRVIDNNYIWLSGTSMAAPVVSGLAALAFEANPHWTNDQVKWLLQNTATRIGSSTSPVPGQGAGQVDGAAVVRYSGTPGSANQGLTASDLLVGPDGKTTYTSDSAASSWSSSSWSSSSWSSSSWSSSSWSSSNWSTASLSAADEEDENIE